MNAKEKIAVEILAKRSKAQRGNGEEKKKRRAKYYHNLVQDGVLLELKL